MAQSLPQTDARAGGAGAAASLRTLAGAVAAARAIADAIGASDFAVFSIGAARERGRLSPLFDSDYPDVSAASTILSSTFGDEFVRNAVTSTLPRWWSGERESLSTRAFAALHDSRHTALGLPDMPGIAFPVYAEQGAVGLVAFLGTDIDLTDDTMAAVHARCFGLFADVARMDLAQISRAPLISQRELDCLRLTASGYTSEEIALTLGLSVHTTNQYLTKVAFKMNTVSRMHAVAKALRLGLIE